MKKAFLLIILAGGMIFTASCNNQQGQMKGQGMQQATVNMAKNESVQKAFSDGRLRVMQNDPQIRRSLLHNTLQEQRMMAKDSKLSDQLVALQVNIREKALRNPQLKNEILWQGIRERMTALQDPATAQTVKKLALDTEDAIAGDKKLRTRMLQQNISQFRWVAEAPSLRPQMAEAMLPLLKDPQIVAELEKMIKAAVAKEMKKMQQQMLQQMQQQMKPPMKNQQQGE